LSGLLKYLLLLTILLSTVSLSVLSYMTYSWEGQWVEVVRNEITGYDGILIEVSKGDEAYLLLELMVKPPKQVEGRLYSSGWPITCSLPAVESIWARIVGDAVVSEWVSVPGPFTFGDIAKVYVPIKVLRQAGEYVVNLTYRIECLSCENVQYDKVIYNKTFTIPINVLITGKPKVRAELAIQGNLSLNTWSLAKVAVENSGDAAARNLVVEVTSSDAVINRSVIYIDELPEGSRHVEYIKIKALHDHVTTSVKVKCSGPKGLEYSYLGTYAFSTYTGRSFLRMTTDTPAIKSVVVGSLAQVRVNIRCLGSDGEVHNVKVSASSPGATVTPQAIDLGLLRGGESRDVILYVKPQTPGEVPVYIMITYVGSDGSEYSLSEIVSIKAVRPPLITLTPAQPYVSECIHYLEFTITNYGDSTAQDINIVVTSISGAIPKVRGLNFSALPPSETLVARIPVANVSNDVEVCLDVTYLDPGSGEIRELSECLRYPLLRTLNSAMVRLAIPREVTLKPGECVTKGFYLSVEGLTESIRLDAGNTPLEVSVVPAELHNKSTGTYSGNLTICVPKSVAPGNYLVTVTCRYLSRNEWRTTSAIVLVHVEDVSSPLITVDVLNQTVGVGVGEVFVEVNSSKPLKELLVKVTSDISSTLHTYYGVRDVRLPLKVTVLPHLVGRSVDISVWVKYIDVDGIEGTATFSTPVLVIGEPELHLVYVTVAPKVAVINSTVAVSALLANRGVASAYATIAEVEVPEGFEVIGEPSIYLGEVAPGSTSVVSFSMRVTSAPPGTYEVPIKVSYYDSLHKLCSEVFNVSVTVGNYSVPTSSASGGTGGLGIHLLEIPSQLLTVLIIAVVGAGAVITVLAIRGSRG